jgi:hypothetical protein
MADYGGDAIFGRSVTIAMEQAPSAVQLDAFFGLSGVASLYGGGRGRAFLIEGVLVGSDAADLAAARALFLSYDDGIARDLTDTWGVTWPQVVFRQFQPQGRVMQLAVAGGGLALPYRAVFEGRI